ncbi:MAG: ABC-F family ATP-binding cassette domain-containing protein [Lachnospiraceae bacterium]|nr:ABC-F family ATP-binding cassette domain-containing protein [Lachnospiraceae bacterium]
MLQLKNITITHRKDLREIVKDFSFILHKGDRAVIIGEEGNGKSTLLKLIYQESLIEEYAEYTGEIVRNQRRLGYLAQELPREQREWNVNEYFYQIPGFFEAAPKELGKLSKELGISPGFFYEDRKVQTLSGGEKVKMQMAGILLDRPEILLLDEPSNDIDLETLEWLEEFIRNCELPVLYVSHDETFIQRTANVIIHFEQIKRKTTARHTVVRMEYEQYIRERLNHLQRQEQAARKERSDYAKQMERFRKIQQTVEYQQNTITRQNPHGGKLLKKKMHNIKSMERRFEKQHENQTEMPDTESAIFAKFSEQIQIPNGKIILDLKIDKLYATEKSLLSENIYLRVQGPERVCIVGRNGVGKTTLLRKIAEELLERKDIRAAYMPQNYEELLDIHKTPVEFLQREHTKEEYSRIRTYLGSMKYTSDEMEHSISELSGGQKAKLLFLKMSMEENDVLILDEPTRNFSPLSNPVIRELLRNYGGAIISVSHDRKYVTEICSKVYRLTEKGLLPVEILDE